MNSNYRKVRIDKRNGLESEVEADAASTMDCTESVYKHTDASWQARQAYLGLSKSSVSDICPSPPRLRAGQSPIRSNR